MARRWIHPDVEQAVHEKYLDLCTKAPGFEGQSKDNVFNIAADVIRFNAQCSWAEFQQKYNLGVFK